MAVSPTDMVLFAVVVREASFTGAARTLGVTKQSVSERLAKLEAELGVRLLERTTRRLRVTEAGATYAERCSALAAQVEEANAEVRRQQSEPVGLLRVSAPVLYGRRYLAPVDPPLSKWHRRSAPVRKLRPSPCRRGYRTPHRDLLFGPSIFRCGNRRRHRRPDCGPNLSLFPRLWS